ncbi:hypothetical protein Ae201684P_008648 [Aphanomyces euteiches]|nr:hypothetical protein Ae201684P_008648 [Aphanomyces euteiches]
MFRDKATDKTLLQDMVRKSQRRLVHLSTGHRLCHALDDETKQLPDISPPKIGARNVSFRLPAHHGHKYAIPDDTNGFDVHDAPDLPKIHPHVVAVSTSITQDEVVNNNTVVVETDNRALYRQAMADIKDINALGAKRLFKKDKSKSPEARLSSRDAARQWFRNLQSSAHELAPSSVLGGCFHHSKWQPLTFGSTVFLESCATRTCLRISGNGKSVPNSSSSDGADPGTLLRLVDFVNPARRGSIYDGDFFWLRLDTHRPDLPKKRDAVAVYLHEMTFLLSWTVASVANGAKATTEKLASVLETTVPSVAHYGFDASMAECLSENGAAMHLAKWTIGLGKLDSCKANESTDDAYHHERLDPTQPLHNYSLVNLLQGDLALGVDPSSNNLDECNLSAAPFLWRVCIRDTVAMKRQTDVNLVKATSSLDESRQTIAGFATTRKNLHRRRTEVLQASTAHLAMVDHVKEIHKVEYFTHKYKANQV